MKIILQPCANKDAKDHFQKTIRNSIGSEDIVIWGVKKNNKEKWRTLREGDLVLFSANRRFFSKGTIVATMHNQSLARRLWKIDEEDDQTWEYIYFMSDSGEIDKGVAQLNETMGYKENYNIRSFQIIDDPVNVAEIVRMLST